MIQKDPFITLITAVNALCSCVLQTFPSRPIFLVQILRVEQNKQWKLKVFHPQLFLPNTSLEQISSQELKIPALVSQVAPVRKPLL